MNTRRGFIAFLPAVAMGQSRDSRIRPTGNAENIAAVELVRTEGRALRLIRAGDVARQRDARVESANAFKTMTMFMSPETKQGLEALLRSDWSQPDINNLGAFYRSRFDIDLGTDEQVKEMFTADLTQRGKVIELLDTIGIDGILSEVTRYLHPDVDRYGPTVALDGSVLRRTQDNAGCYADHYMTGFYAAMAIMGSGFATATFFGCFLCGPVAGGIGLGVAILKGAQYVACL